MAANALWHGSVYASPSTLAVSALKTCAYKDLCCVLGGSGYAGHTWGDHGRGFR